MENRTTYNMSRATKIEFIEQPDGAFYIKLVFSHESVNFRYVDKSKAEEAFSMLSQFQGTVTQSGDELTINL